MCYPAKFGRSRSFGTSVIKEIRLKEIDPSRPAFQGHRNRHGSIRHPRLPINVPYQTGPISHVSEINGDFSRNSHFPPHEFSVPAEFAIGIG